MQYDSTNDYFVMVPNTTNGATNTDYVRISTANLLKSIYAQLGPIETSPNGKSGTWTVQPTTTPNSPDGQVAKYFVAGFDAGYWGATAHAPNPRDPTQIDLNKTANWNFNYAYGGAFNPIGTTAVAVTNPVSGGFYDSWAKDIQLNSNSYGWSYGDLISQGGTNPQLSLWDATKKQQVQNIDITLYSNSEPMPNTSGFQGVPPSYVAPTGSTYMPVNTPINIANNNNANLISVNFTVSAGSLSVNPNDKTPAFFKFYAPGDTQAGPDHFVSLSLTDTGSDWSNFNVVGTPGNWSLQSFSANSTGNFNIYNMPVTADGSTGWYQIVFGDASKGQATVYNFYAKSDSSGHFLDISSNPNNFVTDHGLGYGPGLGTAWMTGLAPGQTGYVLTLAPSGVMTYNIATLSAPGTIFGTSGNDILNGTLGSDTINGAPGNDSIAGGAGTDTAWSWEPSKNFALTTTAGSNNIALRDKVGTDGTDTLASIERVHFSDFTLDASTITKTAALPVDQIMKVVDLYTAGLNRAPDAVGLNYWASRLADGTSISDISKAIFSSAEAMPLYSAANSNPTLVNFAYLTAFGRAPDAAGAAYWTNELNTGHLQRTDIVTALVAGARAPGGGVLDAQYIANKEAVGAHFALTQGLNNPVWARTVETNVNGTAASVTAADAQTDAFAATAATAASTELVVQILGLVP